MQTHHVSSHELALLERFVHDCVQQLPKLPTATPHQLPQRCSSYHTGCAAMLRQVLGVLEPLSPRMCQLVAQVWDLTSLNFFVLIQLAQSSLEEKDGVQAKWRQLQRFCEETTVQHAQRVTKYEAELEQVRLESRELRAELQKTRQKANRLGVENAQLRKAVDGLMEMNDTLNNRMSDGLSVVERLDDNVLDASERGIRSDAEEWELYGVSTEELERLDVVHPIESCAQDFDQLFEGLFDREREQMALVNEMDRFMNSNVVALLWRHGPDEDNTKFLEQMMNKRTIGSQTEDDELSILSEDLYGGSDGDGDADGDNNNSTISSSSNGATDPSLVSGQTGKATVMTKRQLLPPPLRAQLTTRPKIQRVLEKDQLSQIVLLVLLEKMEVDGTMIRQHQPRVALHRFMKEFFSCRYGLVPLAEYRMMELVKSILYYHEKQEAEARRMRQITGAAPPTSAAPQPQLQQQAVYSGWSFCLLPGLDVIQLSRDDLRISLFARLCELVPLQWSDVQVAPVAGNLFACAINALLDFLGDVIELDRSCGSLRELVSRFNGSSGRHQHWEVSMETASLLVAHHFAYCDTARVEIMQNRLEMLAMDAADGSGRRETSTVSSLALLPVDSLLVFFATQWFENDQRLTARLHDAFHRQVLLQREREGYDVHYESPPMETLRRVWQGLGDEHLSALDLHELERAFESILELRKTSTQQATSHSPLNGSRRVSTKRQSIVAPPSLFSRTADSGGSGSRPGSASPGPSAATMGLCVGGISEKEFVFQTQQVLRVRRVCRGLRTNGRCIADAKTQQHFGARGRVVTDERETVAAVASYELKPGLADAAADK